MLGSSYNEEYRVNTVHAAPRQKEKGAQRERWLDGITASMDLNLSKLWKMVEDRGAWHSTVHGCHKESDTN